MRSFTVKNISALLLLTFGLMAWGSGMVKGQSCTLKVRRYANAQRFEGQGILGLLPGTIANPNNAISTDPTTFSTLTVALGLLNLSKATQYLEFTNGSNVIKKNTPATVKMTLPTSVLALLNNVKIQAYTNGKDLFGNWVPTPVGPEYEGSSLLSLLNGIGEFEFTIVPDKDYQGVYVSYGSAGLALGLNANIYFAYIEEDAPAGTYNCNDPIDVLSGTKPGNLGGVADILTSVTTPRDAIDTDPNFLTYAEFNPGVQVASQIFHTTIFKNEAKPGDVVKMVIEKPAGGLLSLSVLSNFTIQLYNKSTPVGQPITNLSTGLLSLRLLPGTTAQNTKRELLVSVPLSYGAYDRVQISLSGFATVGALEPSLRLYDVRRIIKPMVQIGGSDITSKSFCTGTKVPTLSIKDPQSCTKYNWYQKSNNLLVRQDSTSFTPLASSLSAGQNIFYVVASRTNCTETSEQILDTLNLIPPITNPLVTPTTICMGLTGTFTISNITAGQTYNWFDAASGGNLLNTGTSYTTGVITANTTFYVQATNGPCLGPRVAINITVDKPNVTLGPAPSVCQGEQNAVLTYATPKCAPTEYKIVWDLTAVSAGFSNNATFNPLPSSSISIQIPDRTKAPPGTYNGLLTVRNSSATSADIPIQVTIRRSPNNPSVSIQ